MATICFDLHEMPQGRIVVSRDAHGRPAFWLEEDDYRIVSSGGDGVVVEAEVPECPHRVCEPEGWVCKYGERRFLLEEGGVPGLLFCAWCGLYGIYADEVRYSL